jgi:hypothetical protein
MDAEQMFAAGRELEEGGSVKDLPAIEGWYRKAAAAGSVEAMGQVRQLPAAAAWWPSYSSERLRFCCPLPE